MNQYEMEQHIRRWLEKNQSDNTKEKNKPRYNWAVSQLVAVLGKMNKKERHLIYMSLKAIKGKAYPDQQL